MKYGSTDKPMASTGKPKASASGGMFKGAGEAEPKMRYSDAPVHASAKAIMSDGTPAGVNLVSSKAKGFC